MKNTSVLIVLIIFIPLISYSQDVSKSNPYKNVKELKLTKKASFEIKKITIQNRAKKKLDWVFAPEGYRFLIIETVFYSPNGKRDKIIFSDLKFKTDKGTYKVMPYPNAFEVAVIQVKQREKHNLYVLVDKDFQKGILYFEDNKLLEISTKKNASEAIFEIL